MLNGSADLIADGAGCIFTEYFLRMNIPSIILVCYACLIIPTVYYYDDQYEGLHFIIIIGT